MLFFRVLASLLFAVATRGDTRCLTDNVCTSAAMNTSLDFESCGIKDDDVDVLATCFDNIGRSNVESLNLNRNRLTTLPPDLLQGFDALQILNLEFNDITLQAGNFAGSPLLDTLNVRGNEVYSLPSGVFDGLESLRVLNLTGNPLTLAAGDFVNVTSLEELNLDHNDNLQCLPVTDAEDVNLPDTFDDATLCECPEDPTCDEDGVACECQPGLYGYSCGFAVGNSSETIRAFSCAASEVTVSTCPNGVAGVQNGTVCCAVACDGVCGGVGCDAIPFTNGASDCCSATILLSGAACEESVEAPCVMINGIYTETPTTAPLAGITIAPTAGSRGVQPSITPTAFGSTTAPSAGSRVIDQGPSSSNPGPTSDNDIFETSSPSAESRGSAGESLTPTTAPVTADPTDLATSSASSAVMPGWLASLPTMTGGILAILEAGLN